MLALMLLALALACVAPTARPSTPTPDAHPTQPATSSASATPLATPAIPPDWIAYHSESLRLSLAYPPGWEASSRADGVLDLRQSAADGWLEIEAVTAAAPSSTGLVYAPGMGGDTIAAQMLRAAREDGTFSDPQEVGTRSGLVAWAYDGHDESRGEDVFVAVLAAPDRALILVGHGADADGWAALSGIYRLIAQSLSLD